MRGGGLKDWYHHLFRAMISFSEADKPSVVEKHQCGGKTPVWWKNTFEDLSAFSRVE